MSHFRMIMALWQPYCLIANRLCVRFSSDNRPFCVELVPVCTYLCACACGFARCLESAIQMLQRSKASGECALNLTGLAVEILLCLLKFRTRLEQRIAVDQSVYCHPFPSHVNVTFCDIYFKIMRDYSDILVYIWSWFKIFPLDSPFYITGLKRRLRQISKRLVNSFKVTSAPAVRLNLEHI